MSYYILPKTNNNIFFNPTCESEKCSLYISQSLYNYYYELKDQLNEICLFESSNMFEEMIKIINPYEYIYSKVPGSKFSVSKLKPKTNLFYDFLEIFNTLNILETYKNKSIKTMYVGSNYDDFVECIEILRENFNDKKFHTFKVDEINLDVFFCEEKFDLILFELNECDLNSYIIRLTQILMFIFRYQASDGICLIKINYIFHKPIIDIIYLLTSIFEKTYVIKPYTSNSTTFDKYIVCKNFIINENKINIYIKNYLKLKDFLNTYINTDSKTTHIVSMIDMDIPCYFINKLVELNVIIGQQQLDSLNHIMNILKNKNKEEKIETIKKLNIQKSVYWCEKYKIPCNKFSEKTNIFLPIINEIRDIEIRDIKDLTAVCQEIIVYDDLE